MSKKIEEKGFEYLKHYVEIHFPGACLKPTMNKGRGESVGIADAILEYDDKKVHIEIKASSKTIGTNIRFTHQTISKALGHDLVVAIITNLANPDSTEIEFFSLGAVQESIIVEPHFIIQKKAIKNHRCTLSSLLQSGVTPLSLSKLLKTEVGEHIVQTPSCRIT